MICPHCFKAITWRVTPAVVEKIKKLCLKGYSTRDIETLLKGEKISISYASVARVVKRYRENE